MGWGWESRLGRWMDGWWGWDRDRDRDRECGDKIDQMERNRGSRFLLGGFSGNTRCDALQSIWINERRYDAGDSKTRSLMKHFHCATSYEHTSRPMSKVEPSFYGKPRAKCDAKAKSYVDTKASGTNVHQPT